MGKLTYFTMMSLDGFIEGPQHELDWVTVDAELHKYVNARQAEIATYLYGRRMYEAMQAAWPTADQDPAAPDYIVEFAQIWRRIPKLVFSQSLDRVEGNATLVRSDVVAEVARLRAQPGENLEVGGARLAASLLQQGLVDEYELYIHPVVLGRGTRVFAGVSRPLELRLVETHRFGSGVVMLRYLSAAAAVTGAADRVGEEAGSGSDD